MDVKVSVVVPVYNPGHYIEPLIASLDRQSVPRAEFEAIFVDDGSTDGTGERLDRLAEERENVRVVHIPNSGWPGRPRNVGIDHARGRYVLFVDNDDWLGDEALERLYDFAERNGSDVVVGKEVGDGMAVPRRPFRRNVAHATLQDAPLLDILTPHKLFRRAFLDEHRIRFPEGPRRLEDHQFVMRAYFAAERISILADYPAYHWVKRRDAGNNSSRAVAANAYYDNVREVLDIVEASTEPGERRDVLLAHWLRAKTLERLRGPGWAAGPDARALEWFEAARSLARERFGPGVVAQLPMRYRVQARALLANRPDLVAAQARIENGMKAQFALRRFEREGDVLRLCLSATIADAAGEPIRFRRDGGRTLWEAPSPLGGDSVIRDEDRDVAADLERTEIAVVFKRRDSGLEYEALARVERVLSDGEHPVFDLVAGAEIDLRTVAAGTELVPGTWDLFAHVNTCGWRSLRRLGDVSGPEPMRHRVLVHTTQFGNLSLKVGSTTGQPSTDPPAVRPAPAPTAQPEPSRRLRLPAPLRWLVHLLPRPIRRTGRRMILRPSRQPR